MDPTSAIFLWNPMYSGLDSASKSDSISASKLEKRGSFRGLVLPESPEARVSIVFWQPELQQALLGKPPKPAFWDGMAHAHRRKASEQRAPNPAKFAPTYLPARDAPKEQNKHVMCTNSRERGSGGGTKWRCFPKCEDDTQGWVPKCSLPPKLFKQGIWSSHFLRDLSQVVRRTPRDTPVPFHTCTSPWAIVRNQEKGGFSKGGLCRVQCHAQGNKGYPRMLGPAVHVALRAPQPREACVFAKTP